MKRTNQINKLQLVEQMAIRNGISVSDSERYLNNLIHLIYHELKAGTDVNISGFGKFSVSKRAERLGVNPRTFERITIPAYGTPKFKAGEAFKDAVRKVI